MTGIVQGGTAYSTPAITDTTTTTLPDGRNLRTWIGDVNEDLTTFLTRLGSNPQGSYASLVARLVNVDTQLLASSGNKTLPVSSYVGYDDADGTIAMTAWMQAFFDAADQNLTLIVPRTSSKWALRGAETTSTSTTLNADTSASGTQIVVASATNFPTVTPFKVILNAGAPATSQVVTVTAVSGTTWTLAARTTGNANAWFNGKALTGTFTVTRALPLQPGQKVKGQQASGAEGTACAVQVQIGSYFVGYSGGTDLSSVFLEDVAFWSSENATTTVARPFMYPGSSATFKDSVINRCHFKWFTQVKLLSGRLAILHSYFNNLVCNNTVGTRLTPADEGLVHLGGSDNFWQRSYVDSWYQGVPSEQALVKINGYAESTIDYMYLTPAPCRPLEWVGYADGAIANVLVNGLNEHNTRETLGISPASSGTAASRPAGAAYQRGWLYEATDTRVVSRCTDPATWVTIVDDTNLVTGSPFASKATLPAAASWPRRWAQVSDATELTGIKSYYSDGVRWRGPHFDSPGVATSPASGYLGSDYGVWIHDTKGVIQINSMSLRSVAQFDTVSPGSLRVENASVQIGNLALWSSGGTSPVDVYCNNGLVQVGQVLKDGAATPLTVTLAGTGRVDQHVATDSARLIGDAPRWDGTRWLNRSTGRHKSGYWAFHENPSASTGSLGTLGDLRIAPINTGGNGIQAISLFDVTVASAATGVVRLVIYADGVDGYPGALLYQGTVATDTLGQKTLTGLTVPGSPTGRHWVGAVAQVATSPTTRVWVNRTMGVAVPTLAAAGAAPSQTALLLSGVTGTAPDPFTATPTGNSSSMPMIAVQLA